MAKGVFSTVPTILVGVCVNSLTHYSSVEGSKPIILVALPPARIVANLPNLEKVPFLQISAVVLQDCWKFWDFELTLFMQYFGVQINNVGYVTIKPTLEYTAEDYSSMMSTNLESVFHSCLLAHPLLKSSGNGSIVSISSTAGVIVCGPGAVYAASKGMSMFLCSHFIFFQLWDIRVHIISLYSLIMIN